ncbi:glycosyltransferase family A protein [Halorubrum ezzemoulense]|uniref:glycosyltransferase family 2 protein n=1 Tax=Halorubrum ezzemoulense TaxID=337243 RepID=UPI00232EC843|nr:glycosyltransferase family A protein [Halorubrum ezzemoulense]MDB2262069.1 glycosyltransferase family A protein [Halorubrum ezzemoulense]MDB2268916.1 glycosyltransferase family A protein [Halorubrum ezzemoulense]
MDEPTVSVVTPSYDRPEFILSAVETVKSQTYSNIEHIIVDDCSPRPVSDVLSTDQSDIIVHRHDTNQGANAARNTGADIASGKYISFLDDDDEWEPEKIERQVDTTKRTGAGAIYTGIKQKLDGEIIATQTPNLNGDITKDLLTGAPLNSTSTVLFRADVFDQAGTFDEELPINQDWEFYIRASTVTDFAAIPEPLVTRHHHDSQISDDYIGKRDVTVPRMLEKHLDLAARYGVDREFKSTLQFSLGATAVRSGHWRAARRHYFRSLVHSPSRTTVIRLLALLFGRWSYLPAQKFRRAFIQ